MTQNRLAKALVNVFEALTLLSTFSLLLAFIFAFDEKLGYFEFGAKSSFPCYTFIAFYVLGFAVALLMGLFTSKKLIIKMPTTTQRAQTPIAIAGTCVILLGALAIIFKNASILDTASSMVGTGAISFGAYCLLVATNIGEKARIPKIIALLCTALIPLGITSANNSNYYRSINSVENDLSIIFGITFLIYILFEGKSISNDSHSRWHIPTSLLAEHCGITISAAYMLAYLLGVVNEPWRFVQMTIVLCISIAISVRRKRLFELSQAKTDEEWQEYYDSLAKTYVDDSDEVCQSSEEYFGETLENTPDKIEEQKETDD